MIESSTPLSNYAPPIPLSSNPFPPCPPIPKASGPVDLILPPSEDRPHKYFTLPNGLECIVVSDPKADKAAASMDVGVGHLSDPDDLPGCAHFCEHMMFLGTKTYPVENDYSTFLSSNNGHSNAWTAMTSTNYFFDVAPDALQGALDRFAGFFYEPMFAEDCTEREINAVNSEHKKNIQNDMWRCFQLEKSLSKPGHPFGKFGTGNRETLWDQPKADGRDPRQQLIQWWEKEYCARRMKLALVGKEDVDVLESWVRERFAKVPIRTEGKPEVGRDGVRIVFEDSPIGEKNLGSITFTNPVRDQRGMEIVWPFPDIDHLYKSRPGNYIAHFLGYEGKGSILSYLKKQGWVNHIRAGTSNGAAGFDMMKVSVDLTPDGLDRYLDVGLVIFKYISLLRSSPPSKMIFEEMKQIGDISFRFAERGRTSSYVSGLSGWMQEPVPREKIVSSKYVLEEFNEDELAAGLLLLDPRRATMGVISQTLPKDVAAEGGWDKVEPIYGTQYTQRKLSDEFIQEAMKGASLADLALPGQNKFIPLKLDVEKFEVKEPAKRPELLRDTDLSRLWYKRDDRFWVPKANVDVLLTSPLFDVSPRNAVLSRLLCDMFSDSITEESYDAELADLNFDLHYDGEAIQISAGGFSDKLSVLTETMLKTLVEFKIDAERFEKIKDQAKRHWINFALSEPYNLANYWYSFSMSEQKWTQDEKLKEIDFITAEEVAAFGKEVFKRLHIETLVHGNTSVEGANELQNMLERVLGHRALTPGERKPPRSLLLPTPSEIVYTRSVPNASEVNNAIAYYLQIGDPTDPSLSAKLSLFNQIASEPSFNTLRTKEQLGYTVFCNAVRSAGSTGLRIIVQSERSAVYVETRIEAFLELMKKIIDELSEEEYSKHQQSLIMKEEEKPKNLGEETRKFWSRISDKYYQFGRNETMVENLRKTSKKDIQDFWTTYISASSPTRTKFSTHLNSQVTPTKGEIKFDANSGGGLVEAFKKHSIDVDVAALGGLMATKPSLEAVQKFARDAVGAMAALTEDVKSEVEGVIASLKGSEDFSEIDGKTKLRDGNVIIEDIYEFKAGLVPSKAARPLEPLSPVAKL